MYLPEWCYWIIVGVVLLTLLLSHAPTLMYKFRRKKWLATHIRLVCFHLNHTISSAWIPVDAVDGNSKIVTYEKKIYLYKVERVIRLPVSFGLYAREPCLFVCENNSEPLDMVNILKQMQSKKSPDEVYEAINSKVFIDLMRGVADGAPMKWMLVVGAIIAVLYIASEYFKKGGA